MKYILLVQDMQQSRKVMSEEGSENPEAKPTVTGALTILKQLEGRIETTKKKLYVMNLRNEKQSRKEKEERRKLITRSMVERDIQDYHQRKKQVETHKQAKLEEHKIKNSLIKKELKEKVDFARLTCRETKSLMYSRGKKQENENQKIIKKNKNKLIKQKRKKYWAVIQSEIQGRKRVERFLESRMRAQKTQKQSQTSKLLQNIDQRRKVLTKLERYGSVEELDERRVGSTENVEWKRNFRVKIVSKGKTTFVKQ